MKLFGVGVISCLHEFDVDSFAKSFDALVSHWDKCLSRDSQYDDRWRVCLCVCLKTYIHFITCSFKNGSLYLTFVTSLT